MFCEFFQVRFALFFQVRFVGLKKGEPYAAWPAYAPLPNPLLLCLTSVSTEDAAADITVYINRYPLHEVGKTPTQLRLVRCRKLHPVDLDTSNAVEETLLNQFSNPAVRAGRLAYGQTGSGGRYAECRPRR